MSWFKKLFSADTEASTKRFVAIVLVLVLIVSLFLLMYIRIEVANKDLVNNILENMFWLILIFGGFIAAEPVLNKLKLGGPTNVVNQDVQNQNVVTDGTNTKATRNRSK